MVKSTEVQTIRKTKAYLINYFQSVLNCKLNSNKVSNSRFSIVSLFRPLTNYSWQNLFYTYKFHLRVCLKVDPALHYRCFNLPTLAKAVKIYAFTVQFRFDYVQPYFCS